MLSVMESALGNLLAGQTLLYLMIGVFVGLIIGVLPVLGTAAGMALLIPFVYGMDQASGLAMMTGLLAVVATGDTVTSILMGIPGGSSSQATVLDGFPMARKGEAARALAASYAASLMGGVFGAIVLTAAIMAARPIVLSFGVGELLMLTILGFTMVSVLSGTSLTKGFISCGLGMLVGSIGGSPAIGERRMIIGDFFYLDDGLPLAAVTLAIFAIPEIVDLLRRGEAIAEQPPLGGGWIKGLLDAVRNWWLVLRCSVIGCIIGALPIGGSDWFAYGHAVQTCKPSDGFGKGDVRGVIAPEAANNANAGGALVPTLLFGIPGSGSTAVFLGGIILLGLHPGPEMLQSNLDVVFTIIWSLAIANILGAGICFFASAPIARLTTIPFVYLAPFLLTIIVFGAYQSTRRWGDIVTLFAIGILAVFLRRFGYSRPAFLIGFVLQNSIEILLYQTVQIYTLTELLARPLMWILVLINIASLWFGLANRPQLATEGSSAIVIKPRQLWPQMLFLTCVVAFAVYVVFDVWNLTILSSIFPIAVAAITLIFSATAMVVLLLGITKSPVVFDSEVGWRERGEHRTGLFFYMLWIAGFLAVIYLVGFVLAVIVFFTAFLSLQAKSRWWATLIMVVCVVTVLATLSAVLNIDLPSGLLQDFVHLPWPVG
jgi:putative tricarboxylic transport membrane protein